MLGRFLEISLPADPVLDSVQYYERLGFEQLATADLWPHHYGVISDGRFHLGLHGARVHAPGLSWVREDVARLDAELRAAEFSVTEALLEHDALHELRLDDPEGLVIRVLEVRSFSRPGHLDGDGALGWFRELQVRVDDLDQGEGFWERAGLLPAGRGRKPVPRSLLSCEGLNLCLIADRAAPAMRAVFEHRDPAALLTTLETRGVRAAKRDEDDRGLRAFVLVAPEGLELRVERAA